MDVKQILEKDRVLAVQTLSELISMKSVQEDPAPAPDGGVYPFGQGVQDAFAYMLRKGQEFGFRVLDYDRFGGHIEFGEGSETVGIMAHLDVVPAGEGWSFDPFSGVVKDGFLYGRGATDDKGPLVAAFFAMKALKDSGFEPKRRVRLILGLDEEQEWRGMHHYLEHVGAPDLGFTPDADFPVLYGEKGILQFDLAKKLVDRKRRGLTLRKLSGGMARNVVPEKARALVNHHDRKVYDQIRNQAAAFQAETGHQLTVRPLGRSLEILAMGRSAHASTPDQGLNAISVLFDFLARLDFEDDGLQDFLTFYNDHIGYRTDGSAIGLAMSDQDSGPLTFNVGLCTYDGGSVQISCDVRYPVTKTADQVYERLRPYADASQLGIVRGKDEAPIFMEKDSPLVTSLMEVYREVTGDRDSQPLVIGGGTFARACPNIVAFGGHFQGEPDLMHQRDEKLSLDSFYKMMDIYAAAIRKISGEAS